MPSQRQIPNTRCARVKSLRLPFSFFFFLFSTMHTHAKGGAINRGTLARAEDPIPLNGITIEKRGRSRRSPLARAPLRKLIVPRYLLSPLARAAAYHLRFLRSDLSARSYGTILARALCNRMQRSPLFCQTVTRACVRAREKSRSKRSGKDDYLYATRKLYERLVRETYSPSPPWEGEE